MDGHGTTGGNGSDEETFGIEIVEKGNVLMDTIRERFNMLQREYQESNDPEEFYQNLQELEVSVRQSKRDQEESFLKEFYVTFAFASFDVGRYIDFFKCLTEACKCGYDILLLRETIYEVFVKPNQEIFRKNYEQNISVMKSWLIEYSEDLSFDNIEYYTLPTEQENIFFLMHKKNGKIDGMLDVDLDQIIPPELENAFAGIVVRRDVEVLLPYLTHCTSYKKCYYISENIDKFKACMQSIGSFYLQNLVVVRNHEQLIEYLEKNEEYLPWNIVAYKKHAEDLYERLMDLHKRRLEKTMSKRPLLSICIPSYNRGDKALANIKKILSMNFDYEVEVIVSNNGSDNQTKGEYLELSQIEDSRFVYHEFESNRGYLANSCKVADLARGEFFMLLSDEDTICELGLYQILNLIMKKGKSLAVIKTPHKIKGAYEPGYASKGIGAYQKYMLKSNYLSINIYRKDWIDKYIYYPYDHGDNKACLHYPHMCWELFALQYGDVISTDIFLVDEGEAVDNSDVEEAEINDDMTIYEYQTVEGRLEQHAGFLEVIRTLDIYNKEKNSRLMLYYKLCSKTFFLVNLSINLFYGNKERLSKIQAVRDYCKEKLNEIEQELSPELFDLGHELIDELYFLFRVEK